MELAHDTKKSASDVVRFDLSVPETGEHKFGKLNLGVLYRSQLDSRMLVCCDDFVQVVDKTAVEGIHEMVTRKTL